MCKIDTFDCKASFKSAQGEYLLQQPLENRYLEAALGDQEGLQICYVWIPKRELDRLQEEQFLLLLKR